MSSQIHRRSFLASIGGAAGVAALGGLPASAAAQSASTLPGSGPLPLPAYARAQNYKSLKQSSFDRTGGNRDSWRIEPGATKEVFNADGPGIITHIWYTIAAAEGTVSELKQLVMRIYWDGNQKPSVEVPVGDFFGLNLGDYFVYQSAFLNCSSIKALNAYFAMPFRRSARITIENQGETAMAAFYSNIDYQLVPSLPEDALYFHAQYRQKTPNKAVHLPGEKNLDGKDNYVFLETRGRGHLMGVTMGVLQNADRWFGEGDEMIFIDNEEHPAITGTGTEDYINGAWDFGGSATANQFAHLYNGAPYMENDERTGGRYCLYRWHGDNPVTFTKYLRHTIEHGHANDRADNFYTVGYWYQSEPYTDFPALPAYQDRLVHLKMS
jgi:hypothetical protein